MKITFEDAFRNSYELAQKYGVRDSYVWSEIAHDYQKEPEEPYGTWLIMGGRGSGKTRTGAEMVNEWARSFRSYGLLVGRSAADVRGTMLEGEALDVETPIPTPLGWRTMEELAVGDEVFGHDGKPRRVTWVSEIATNRPCYTVTFSDGESVIADGRHKWESFTRKDRAAHADRGTILTTEQIAQTLVKHGWSNHAVRLCGPVEFPERALPIDPYVLGCWLGDGRSRSSDFTSADPDIISNIEACGYSVSKHASEYAWRILGLTGQLRGLGLLNNKHIPEEYLLGSSEQRLALLQGLMDTDGYVSKRGQCAFDNNNLLLIEGVRQLLMSLGVKVATRSKARKSKGFPDAAPMMRLTFTPRVSVFRMERKRARLQPWAQVGRKTYWRIITSVEPVESVPVKCIAVEGEDHLYLAGYGFVVTHNSGLLTLYPDILYEPSKRRLTWPNGTQAECLYAESPNSLRGPQGHWAWADEIAAWEDADLGDSKGTAWNNLTLATRLGKAQGWRPRKIATTTPKATKLLVDILGKSNTLVTSGSTYANRANLADEFLADIEESYKGTRLEEQEIHGKLVLDSPAALWSEGIIDATRVVSHPNLLRTVVGVDPAASDGETAAETAIIVVGLGEDGHYYVLKDLSMKGKPMDWAKVAVLAARQFNAARVVCEKNNGGLMVQATIDAIDRSCPTFLVWASDGKEARAEPISLLYEKGYVHHVGHFPDMERQMVSWEPRKGMKSPDRLDGLVWALTDLKANNYGKPRVHRRFEKKGDAGRDEVRQRVGMRRII